MMYRNYRFLYAAILFGTALLFSCSTSSHNKKGVEAAMKQYDHLILKLDADSIALLYAPDGDLGNMAHGRDAIRKFLLTFNNLKVLSQSSVTRSVRMNGDSSLQKGTYRQTVVISGKDTVTVKGEYTATWLWMGKNGWHIKRMETVPVQ